MAAKRFSGPHCTRSETFVSGKSVYTRKRFPIGACTDATVPGVCTPVPGACPLVYDPVCGCDGRTYGNECEADAAGVSLAHRGPCEAGACCTDLGGSKDLKGKGIIRTVFDPACGTGGMLITAKDYIHNEINPDLEVVMYGQELNEQTYAIAKSDVLIMGENAENIRQGNSFTQDKFKGQQFSYMLSNPPFGVSWKKEEAFIENEANDPHGRFSAGTPRSSDGALLFLQHMISKMEAGGSRIAIIFNGSPLFTGDAGSGESNMRKWIIENDWLEPIVAMPTDMFYNTGISTYIWMGPTARFPFGIRSLKRLPSS